MGKPNYIKLRTNLRLAINRLKLLEKKKAELALKSRREIADYISNGKDDRARIRVEHIIREDYLVEGMEIIEMFCDLLLARFGLVEKMKEMDPGLEEAIATILWVSPRLQTDILEMKEISKQLMAKYGKEYNDMCVKNGLENVNEKVLIKMGLNAPPKILIENYMIEIAKAYSVPFTPDPVIMMGEDDNIANDLIELAQPSGVPLGFDSLLDPDKKYPKGPGGGGAGGFSGGGGGGGGLSDHKMGAQPNAYSGPPPFQPGSSAFYPGESAPPYESQAGGASGGFPVSPGARLPPPIPSNPPNSNGSSPAGKSVGGSPAGRGAEHPDEVNIYDYAMTPEQRGPPPAYNGFKANPAGASAFSNHYYGGNREDIIPSTDFSASNQNPFQGYPTDNTANPYNVNPAAGGGSSSGADVYQPLFRPPGGGGGGGGQSQAGGSDDIYVPVLPDVPGLPGENVQSGKHNTDYLNSQQPQARSHSPNPASDPSLYVPVLPDIPGMDNLPSVPQDSVNTNAAGGSNEDVDFDDLTKRFEALKRIK